MLCSIELLSQTIIETVYSMLSHDRLCARRLDVRDLFRSEESDTFLPKSVIQQDCIQAQFDKSRI